MNYYDGYKKEYYSLIEEVSKNSGRNVLMIEKDLIQSLFLYKLSSKNGSLVFKGGTALSKAYKLIERFSEDIDLSIDHKPTQSEKRNIYNLINEIAFSLNLKLINKENVKSRYDYNKYVFEYDSLFSPKPLEIIIETSFYCLSYPIEKKEIDSIVGSFISKRNISFKFFNVKKFSMNVQTLERTFIDKIFAISDYYLLKESLRESRHLYDLYKIYPFISFDINFVELIKKVKEDNSHIKSNRVLTTTTNIQEILKDIIKSDFYKKDYNSLTKKLLYENVSYKTCIENCLSEVICLKIF